MRLHATQITNSEKRLTPDRLLGEHDLTIIDQPHSMSRAEKPVLLPTWKGAREWMKTSNANHTKLTNRYTPLGTNKSINSSTTIASSTA